MPLSIENETKMVKITHSAMVVAGWHQVWCSNSIIVMMTTTMMSQYKVRRSIYHVMFFFVYSCLGIARVWVIL